MTEWKKLHFDRAQKEFPIRTDFFVQGIKKLINELNALEGAEVDGYKVTTQKFLAALNDLFDELIDTLQKVQKPVNIVSSDYSHESFKAVLGTVIIHANALIQIIEQEIVTTNRVIKKSGYGDEVGNTYRTYVAVLTSILELLNLCIKEARDAQTDPHHYLIAPSPGDSP